MELNGIVHHVVQGGLGQLFHGEEPLQGQPRLNDRVGALRAAYAVRVVFGLDQMAGRLKHPFHFLSDIEPILACEGSTMLVQRAVGVENVDGLQVVFLTQVVVVDVVRRGHLQATRSEFAVHVFVEDDRHLPIGHGHPSAFAVEVGEALVFGVDANRCVAHDGLRAGGRDGQVFAGGIHDFIPDVVEFSVLFGVDDFFIAQRRLRSGVPVDHALTPVDEAFLVKVDEGVNDAIVVLFIHCEAGARPVTTGTELLQLFEDDPPVFVGPVPRVSEEFIPRQVRLLDALLTQPPHDFGFGGDGCVVRTRHPAGVLAHHARAAHQHVLDGVVEHVPHVQHTRDIRRGNDHRVGLAVVGLAFKKAVLQPVSVPLLFAGTGIVSRRDLHF